MVIFNPVAVDAILGKFYDHALGTVTLKQVLWIFLDERRVIGIWPMIVVYLTLNNTIQQSLRRSPNSACTQSPRLVTASILTVISKCIWGLSEIEGPSSSSYRLVGGEETLSSRSNV